MPLPLSQHVRLCCRCRCPGAPQGAEKEVVILATTISRPGPFVGDAQRLNVALTRARRHLLVVGAPAALRQTSPVFDAIMRRCQAAMAAAASSARPPQHHQLPPRVASGGGGRPEGIAGPSPPEALYVSAAGLVALLEQGAAQRQQAMAEEEAMQELQEDLDQGSPDVVQRQAAAPAAAPAAQQRKPHGGGAGVGEAGWAGMPPPPAAAQQRQQDFYGAQQHQRPGRGPPPSAGPHASGGAAWGAQAAGLRHDIAPFCQQDSTAVEGSPAGPSQWRVGGPSPTGLQQQQRWQQQAGSPSNVWPPPAPASLGPGGAQNHGPSLLLPVPTHQRGVPPLQQPQCVPCSLSCNDDSGGEDDNEAWAGAAAAAGAAAMPRSIEGIVPEPTHIGAHAPASLRGDQAVGGDTGGGGVGDQARQQSCAKGECRSSGSNGGERLPGGQQTGDTGGAGLNRDEAPIRQSDGSDDDSDSGGNDEDRGEPVFWFGPGGT